MVAVVPFVMIHIGKPDLEALSTLGGGLVFGWLNWRTGSIWASAAYHVAIQTTVIVAAAAWAAAGTASRAPLAGGPAEMTREIPLPMS